ncbi:MAG: polysaccharide pyruvyl transferase family protein, partial [Alteraurantiacibacter sp.]
IKVGVNFSALLYSLERSPHKNIRLTVDYPELIERIMQRLTTDPKYEVHLVPHVIASPDAQIDLDGHYEDDYTLALQLKERFPEVHLPDRFASPSAAKTYIAALDLFMGSRMHATIAALSSETAVLPLGYSRKFNGLFESLGYARNADMTRISTDAAIEQLERSLVEWPAMQTEAAQAFAEAKRRLVSYEDFLDQTMAGLAKIHA